VSDQNDNKNSLSLTPTLLGVSIVLLVLATILIVSLARRATGGLKVPEGTNLVQVEEYSYGFRIANTTLPAGNTVFVAKNAAAIPHEFVIFKTDDPAARLPLKADRTADEESRAVEVVVDSGEAIAPGRSLILSAKLDSGHYVLVCNLPPDHYQAGMRVDLTVE
jgi:uncharacterized cupredoxin-like copper-binding protein